jgi:hypothetical protein
VARVVLATVVRVQEHRAVLAVAVRKAVQAAQLVHRDKVMPAEMESMCHPSIQAVAVAARVQLVKPEHLQPQEMVESVRVPIHHGDQLHQPDKMLPELITMPAAAALVQLIHKEAAVQVVAEMVERHPQPEQQTPVAVAVVLETVRQMVDQVVQV